MRIPTVSRQSTAGSTGATSKDDRSPVTPRRADTGTTSAIPRTEAERAEDMTTRDLMAGREDTARPATPYAPAGPKPRASFIATLALISGVAAALLVLSGPLLGYGMGVAGLGLILSAGGILATRKRHVAGKTDALIGLALSVAALVTGVLALTGQLSWLGTDLQPVTTAREWLDTQFETRF